MAYTITMNSEQIQEMRQVVEVIWELKRSGPTGIRLSQAKLQVFENEYLMSILTQMLDNNFPVNHKTKNTFVWLMDQIDYVGLNCEEYDMVQRVYARCVAASTSPQCWRQRCEHERYERLFR